MEIVVGGLAVLILAVVWYANRTKGLDADQDGKIDIKDAEKMLDNTVTVVKTAADVNNDSKVNLTDAAVAVQKAVDTVTHVADVNKDGSVDVQDAKAAVTTVKKAAGRGRKPKIQQ